MDSPTYRIATERGVVIADGLPRSAPAIQLHEGRVAEPAATRPKDLAPGEFTTVVYPLDAEKGQKRPELRCTVTRTDVAESNESAPSIADNETSPVDHENERRFEPPGVPVVVSPEQTKCGGRRSRKAGAP